MVHFCGGPDEANNTFEVEKTVCVGLFSNGKVHIWSPLKIQSV